MRTGLFFGSFNPIHIGHVIIANHFLAFTDLKEVWFVVSPHNPLKSRSTLLDAQLRLKMVTASVSSRSGLKVSNVEFSLPQPSYTIETLNVLTKKYRQRQFVLLMGSDNLESLPEWKDYEIILSNHSIYIYKRHGFPAKKFHEAKQIQFFDFPFIDISATYIRNIMNNKKALRFLIPDEALDILLKNLTK